MKRIISISLITALVLGSCSKSTDAPIGFRDLLYMSAVQVTNVFIGATYSPSKNKKAPPTVVGDFVLAISDGQCDVAIKSTTGRALEMVQSNIDAGCQPYKTIILSMNCVINEASDSAICACEEERDGMSMTYNYDLLFLKREWKIENYQKDLGNIDTVEEDE